MNSYYFPNYLKEMASDLAIGSSIYTSHEGCTESNKLWLYNSSCSIGYYCNKCGAKGYTKKGIQHISKLIHEDDESIEVTKVVLPKDIDYDINNWPSDAKLWLYSSDIRNFQIKKYGIGYSKRLHRVIIPVYNENEELVTWQGRGLLPNQTKYLNLKNKNKNLSLYKSWVSKEKIHKYSNECVVLVEDALSVIKVGRIMPTVASLGTSLSTSQINILSDFNKVIVWLDEDEGGNKGSLKAIRRLSLFCNVFDVKTQEDPKKLPYEEISNVIRSTLNGKSNR